QATSYLGINTTAMRDTLLPLWLIPGCFEAYGDNGALRWLDRLHTTDPTPPSQLSATVRWFREIRDHPLLEPFAVKTPNRLFTPPSVEGFGTALLVTIPHHEGDNGSPITSCDLRYRPLDLVLDDDGKVTSETTLGPWIEIEDITPNAEGIYIVSPEPTGGLAENTWYCVQLRYNNAVGKGAWSRTHTSSWKDDEWQAGRMFSAQGVGQTGVQMAVAAPRFATPPAMRSFFAEGALARILITPPPLEGANFIGFPFPSVSYQWRLDGNPLEGATARGITIPASAAGKHLSCLVMLSNSEGTDSIVVEGAQISASVADTGYTPTLMSTEGNVRFRSGDGVNLFSTATTKRASVSFIFGGRSGDNFTLIGSNRFEVIIRPNGRISVTISNGLSGTRGYMEFPGPQPQEPHWYLISVDTTQVNEAERIRLWVRPAFSPYPPTRILPMKISDWSGGSGSFQFDQNFRFATSTAHSLFPADPAEQSFIIGDVFMQRDVALRPEDFIAPNGQYFDPALVGGPFLLMGSGMNADDWNNGRNLASAAPATNPLPSVGGGGEFSALD
ncbi:hypothetical protein, partial [Pararhodobacter sp. SW119]|uniref:hypothetical protein n=1 Tax=Pararhodobacter sp. SW119 TaxID=2780075 RepID=UPI001AE09AA1